MRWWKGNSPLGDPFRVISAMGQVYTGHIQSLHIEKDAVKEGHGRATGRNQDPRLRQRAGLATGWNALKRSVKGAPSPGAQREAFGPVSETVGHSCVPWRERLFRVATSRPTITVRCFSRSLEHHQRVHHDGLAPREDHRVHVDLLNGVVFHADASLP